MAQNYKVERLPILVPGIGCIELKVEPALPFVVVRVLVQLFLVSDLLASVFSSPGGYGFRYPDRYTLLPWF